MVCAVTYWFKDSERTYELQIQFVTRSSCNDVFGGKVDLVANIEAFLLMFLIMVFFLCVLSLFPGCL